VSKIPRLFIRTSVLYLVVVSLAGIYLFINPNHPMQFRSAHSHLLEIGWVTIGLAGVMLAVAKGPAPGAMVGWALTNLGVIAMAAAWVIDARMVAGWVKYVQAGAGTLELVGLGMIAYAIWRASAGGQTT
jgi:hypothetical protein